MSTDENGKVDWKRIEAVTKHPVINTDGTNTMLKIKTEGKREVIATKAKSFLKLVYGKIIQVNGDTLHVGDYLPVSQKQTDIEWMQSQLSDMDYSFGYTCGVTLRQKIQSMEQNWYVPNELLFSNTECLKGWIDAYFDQKEYVEIISSQMVADIRQILSQLAIFHEKVGTRIYMRHLPMEDLWIPNEINGEIEFEERNGRFPDILFEKIISIEEIANTTDFAYDLTIEDTRNFNLYNALAMADTFHLAGVGAGSLVITEGIPRLREIINISKNPKNRNMIIYLKEDFARSKEKMKKIQSKFEYTQLKDLLAKTEILYDNQNGMTQTSEDYEFIKSYKEFTALFDIDNIDESCLSPWILRLTFDKESLMNKKITIQKIQETIKENFHNDEQIDCVYSDDSVNDVIMRIKIKQDNKGNFLEFMKDFEKQLIHLCLRGVMNIKQVECAESNLIHYNSDGSLHPSKEWVLKTSGSNLLDILCDDVVDHQRTITNDILEFHEIFGIEATRELIYRELNKVYNEKNPNPRHIQMLADIITYRGKLMQIDRHGLNKNSEIGPIAKASFEEVMNIFTKAALFAEKDNMKGVSANILAGQFCKSGTNAFEILIDEDILMEKIDIPDFDESKLIHVDEKDVDQAFSKAYAKYEESNHVVDNDFTFGFGMEQENEFILDTIPEPEKSLILEKPIQTENTHEIQYNTIEIEEEPEEILEVVKQKTKTKKSNEPKIKKIKVVKKK